jgi:hypothetical protein
MDRPVKPGEIRQPIEASRDGGTSRRTNLDARYRSKT